MNIALKELQAAPWRTALITATIALIAMMITFLSALTQGLGFQSVSALKEVTGDDALVIADTSDTLSGSRLDNDQIAQLESIGATPVIMTRTRLDSGDTAILMKSDDLAAQSSQQLYLDHQPVIWTDDEKSIIDAGGATSAMVIPEDKVEMSSDISGITVLEGSDRWNTSASYAGEQLSLTLMITMLYIVSFLVVGAFFVVWTLQRMHSVAVSSALGASLSVLVAQSLIQAIIVTVVGVVVGGALTVGLIALIGEELPAVVSFGTIVVPSMLVTLSALIGASLSLVPILRVDPRQGLESS